MLSICSKCKKIKPIWAFRNDKKNMSCVRSVCKECDNKYQKKYYRDNIEERREKNIRYHRKTYKKLAGYYAENAMRRYACKLKQTPHDINLDIVKEIYYIRDIITRFKGEQYHVDHIIPLSKGGLHYEDNLQILKASINRSKSDKLDYEANGICKRHINNIKCALDRYRTTYK